MLAEQKWPRPCEISPLQGKHVKMDYLLRYIDFESDLRENEAVNLPIFISFYCQGMTINKQRYVAVHRFPYLLCCSHTNIGKIWHFWTNFHEKCSLFVVCLMTSNPTHVQKEYPMWNVGKSSFQWYATSYCQKNSITLFLRSITQHHIAMTSLVFAMRVRPYGEALPSLKLRGSTTSK